MASRKTRKRCVRKDRRKAKQTGWKRDGRVRWGRGVGHGSGTSTGKPILMTGKHKNKGLPPEKQVKLVRAQELPSELPPQALSALDKFMEDHGKA
jgi:hypothetical protein